MALFVAVPCALSRFAITRLAPGGAAVSGCWELSDLARQFIGTGFPWNPWGSVWAISGLVGRSVHPADRLDWGGWADIGDACCWPSTPALGWRFVAGGGRGDAGGMDRLRDLSCGPRPSRRWPLASRSCWFRATCRRATNGTRPSPALCSTAILALTRQGVAEAQKAAPGVPIAVVWPESASPYLLGQDAKRPCGDLAGGRPRPGWPSSGACASTRIGAHSTACLRWTGRTAPQVYMTNGTWFRSVSSRPAGCRSPCRWCPAPASPSAAGRRRSMLTDLPAVRSVHLLRGDLLGANRR